jgi:DNA-binding ferritin-like protein
MCELGALVSILRAASIVHQSHHWQTRGGNFYGDHLLFERIYNDSLGFIDQVAERAVGSGSRDLVCPHTQAEVIHALVHYWCRTPGEPTSYDMVVVSFGIEHCVVDCLKAARASLEAKNQLSDGTDNLIQGVADKHEEFLYLLQQRQGGRVASYTYRR